MAKINRSNGEIYDAVYKYYRKNRISKDRFVYRLQFIRSVINGDDTITDIVGWIFSLEENMFSDGSISNNIKIKKVQKDIRKDIVNILKLLNIKAVNDELVDEKDAEIQVKKTRE